MNDSWVLFRCIKPDTHFQRSYVHLMDVHQILPGALNRGDEVFSVGAVDGFNFTVCAVGTNIVILSSSFERVQVITPVNNAEGLLVRCVAACRETGKIVATCSSVIRIYDPVVQAEDRINAFTYRWSETSSFLLDYPVDKVEWSLQGLRLLLCCGNELHLYQNSLLSTALTAKSNVPVTFGIHEEVHNFVNFNLFLIVFLGFFKIVNYSQETETENGTQSWDCIWSQKLATKPKFMASSCDGVYFATCGISDCMVKIWYQRESRSTKRSNRLEDGQEFLFGFSYVQHPEPVAGFEWRKVPHLMPKQYVQNVLLTWCEDNTVRVWKEPTTESSDFQIMKSVAEVACLERNLRSEHRSKNHSIRSTRIKIKALVKKILDRRKHTNGMVQLSRTFSKNASLCEIAAGKHAEWSPSFYLCSTINAQNGMLFICCDSAAFNNNKTHVDHCNVNNISDCFLVPTLETSAEQRPFVVHWLNNKEIVYDIGIEKVMVDALSSDFSMEFSKTETSIENLIDFSSENMSEIQYSVPELLYESKESQIEGAKNVVIGTSEQEKILEGTLDSAFSTDSMDFKLDMLVREWKKSSDILFAVHPADGSLLTWTMEWIDDPFRQPTLSFTSRFPSAFSLSDSISLNPSLCVYYPHDFLHVQFAQKNISSAVLNRAGQGFPRMVEQRNVNLLYLLTHHNNGSLNMWSLTMEDNGKFNTIVNILHTSRMCGHRYKISQVFAHPMLPLMLTTSHYNHMTQGSEQTGKAELILWRVTPVGPLCKRGGVRELTRMTSNSSDSFKAVTWLPAIFSGSLLGTLSTPSSSFFVANCSGNFNIYQAIVDAADFLAERHSNGGKNVSPFESNNSTNDNTIFETGKKQSLKEMYKLVSTQSSSKPGCILLLSKIEVASHMDNILLHAFNESLLNSESAVFGFTNASRNSLVGQATVDRYYLASFERSKTEDGLFVTKDEKTLELKDSPCTFNVNADENFHSKLQLITKLVYDDYILLPDGVTVISVEPSAGHLPSLNLYHSCKAPYHVMLACSDDNIRFYECVRNIASNGSVTYIWKMWGMISNNMDSCIEMDGQILSLSAAHSTRFACAYLPEGIANTASVNHIKVGVFECESSGGVEWLREDTVIVNMQQKFRGVSFIIILLFHFPVNNVCLKWVSTEDGSHILTVALGIYVFLYTQVSQGAAQRNIVMMKEHDTHRRAPLRKTSSLANPTTISTRLVRWLCIRFLELQSADDLPPLPTTLGWVRDGLLVIGMRSEMRCYSQWNFRTEFLKNGELEEIARKDLSKRKPPSQLALANLGISQSHSTLDQLSKKSKQETLPLNKQKMYKNLLHRVYTAPYDLQTLLLKDEHVLEAISDEGLFEAARLASPILPQYHPKLLIELLNSGRTGVVKAILLHVLNCLKQLNVSISNPLSRASSVRKMSLTDADLKMEGSGQDIARGLCDTFDDSNLEYEELGGIPPLSLHTLLFPCDSSSIDKEKVSEKVQSGHISLFDEPCDDSGSDRSWDIDSESKKSRHDSLSLDDTQPHLLSINFTAKHNRLLTEFLTHIHLPGLSSVDQVHLLSISDTLSHFSSNVMDKVTQANAAFHTAQPRIVSDVASGYATPTAGFETVDECGLRYLMAMKQHEYLLLCLPLQQKHILRSRGLSPSQIIWALHSETETELLNALPCLQKSSLSWDELRSSGVVWWLKNTSSLRMIIEKLAKAAFQKKQDPLDASLYYLLMKKKNLLTHLFKTVKDTKMLEFFLHDFNEEKWKKAALKNAFVLMGKQRFQHAAAFFLLAGSIKDALQIVVNKLQDLQLAMVIVRLYETDYEEQSNLLRELLCREIFGAGIVDLKDFDKMPSAHRNPFVRSMAYWHLKEYVRAANTLVDEAGRVHLDASTEYSLSDIFNFYSFIRTHPLVIRQRLVNTGIQIGSTEKFLAVAKYFASVITPPERRLYFRTASAHMASGCPLLALDVLTRLPKNLTASELSFLLPTIVKHTKSQTVKNEGQSNIMNLSVPIYTLIDQELNLHLNDSETGNEVVTQEKSSREVLLKDLDKDDKNSVTMDVIAYHMKFIVTLRLLIEELSVLANGFEVDGRQSRYQLHNWLELSVNVLRNICDYRSDYNNWKLFGIVQNEDKFSGGIKALHSDELEKPCNLMQCILRRRRWLRSNQKFLRIFVSYCALHNSQNHRLTAALMELLLLLMEIQGDEKLLKLSEESMAVVHSFPLFISYLSPYKSFMSSPLTFIKSLCSDILLSITDLCEPPLINSSLPKVYKLYSLCQGLSSCLFQSLCNLNDVDAVQQSGIVLRFARVAMNDDPKVTTSPLNWPGMSSPMAPFYENDEAPQLRILLLEIYIAVFVSLFAYGLGTYDARWLFRLAAHSIDTNEFAILFGGGGGVKHIVESSSTLDNETDSKSIASNLSINSSSFHSKFKAKIMGVEGSAIISCDNISTSNSRYEKCHHIPQWIPPKKSIVQFFAEKPKVPFEILQTDYDSDEEQDESTVELENLQKEQHNDSEGFAWWILRLALTHQLLHRMKSFLKLAGLEYSELPALSPRANAVFKLIENWARILEQQLYAMPDRCPSGLLPNLLAVNDDVSAVSSLKKYDVLMERNNTPFECADPSALPVKRIWLYLIHQEHILPLFVKHIFGYNDKQNRSGERESNVEPLIKGVENVFKIVQRDHEPIAAFCCSEAKPGFLVVSNARELQEIDLSALFDGTNRLKLPFWMFNRAEFDVALDERKKDLKDNDDYQLLVESGRQVATINSVYKRQVSGIRRLDPHPTLPYYISGSSDGSIRLWEWGVGQPLFTPRIAGQYAKVTKILFCSNGSKFASVDSDGILCLWQANQGLPVKKPFFNQKCHSKFASDVQFLGPTSSILVTAGLGLMDENISIWDTLMPHSKSLIHSWTAHPEGATSVIYLSSQQSIVSGGRHGELCIWDFRQRRLRTTVKSFDNSAVKCLVSDPFQQIIVAGSNDGDIKVWSTDLAPNLVAALDSEHVARGGFSLRQVASTVQGIQQLYIDPKIRLYSCGADCSLKIRSLRRIVAFIVYNVSANEDQKHQGER
ncbi:unnamed protein product [Thelazia callipaeda]|uniref:WD_REPEATS_REGION domain-containing protein n=1 Tax=Thelazia callipaeda TaxID=103827 RepID=A0A0N5D550_THECL|nr:unnamed protein product [Thelazia callipaeda]